MVFNGTAVAQGVGRAVVTATGMATEMGTIAGLLHATEEEPTPLQREIARVGRMLGIAVIAIAVVVMATILLISDIRSADDVVTVLLLGVSLAVAAVPEGLPAILSVVLAIGVQRMAAHNAIVKKLYSVETLGSASVICSDKTGTLTRSEMTIERVVTASGEVARHRRRLPARGARRARRPAAGRGPLLAEDAVVLGGGSLASNAQLRERRTASGRSRATRPRPRSWSPSASSASPSGAGQRFERVGEVPFTSERKLMSASRPTPSAPARSPWSPRAPPTCCSTAAPTSGSGDEVVAARRRAPGADPRRRRRASPTQAFRTLAVAYRRLEQARRPPADESLSATSSTSAWSASSTRRARRPRPPSPRRTAPASASS